MTEDHSGFFFEVRNSGEPRRFPGRWPSHLVAVARRVGLLCLLLVLGFVEPVRADSFPHGWGANGLAQVGDGTQSDAVQPVIVVAGDIPRTVQPTRISAGGGHSVALGSDGKAYAWGGNGSGQLGDGTTSDRSRAVVVVAGEMPAGVTLQQVSAGGSHTLALGSDGKVYAWGANGYGQLGDGTTVVWGDALREQHLQRMAWLRRQVDGLEQTIARHAVAVAAIDAAGVSCLNDLLAADEAVA